MRAERTDRATAGGDCGTISGVPVLAALTQVMMPGMGSFMVQFVLLFPLSAVFGKLMEDSGSASVLHLRLRRWWPNCSHTRTRPDS